MSRHLIPCDFCSFEGGADELGNHLNASPACKALALEQMRVEDPDGVWEDTRLPGDPLGGEG